jgi:hypothetical protein
MATEDDQQHDIYKHNGLRRQCFTAASLRDMLIGQTAELIIRLEKAHYPWTHELPASVSASNDQQRPFDWCVTLHVTSLKSSRPTLTPRKANEQLNRGVVPAAAATIESLSVSCSSLNRHRR